MPYRWSPVALALVAFVLYVATMAHVHHGDTPLYVHQIAEGDWLARPHMLPRPLGALAVAIGARVAPDLGPYPPLVALDALAGALGVGLLAALALRTTGKAGLAVAVGAAYAVTRVIWGIATTFELALFPVVPLLGAAHLALAEARKERPYDYAAGMGALVAVAFGFHAISIGALPAFVVLLAAEDRPLAERAGSIAALLGATAIGIVTVYQAAIALFTAPGTMQPNAVTMLAQFFEPTKDALEGRIQPASLAFSGFGEALLAAPWGKWAALVWVLALAVGTAVQWRELWGRHRGLVLLCPLWMAGITYMSIRVEAGNYEYYAQPVAAGFVWTALLVASFPRPQVGTAIVGAFAAVIALADVWLILENHGSKDGAHREIGWTPERLREEGLNTRPPRHDERVRPGERR
jgi:hypothetical protein